LSADVQHRGFCSLFVVFTDAMRLREQSPAMKRTLLAIGFAVLASMLFTPHERGLTYLQAYTPEWCPRISLRWFPIFLVDTYWYGAVQQNSILWPNFVGQTAFVAVLAAVLVNLRK
jgi:hypothetical protein